MVDLAGGTSIGRRGAICVLAKAPAPGRVKTRLAATVGDGVAVQLASAFLADTFAMAQRIPNADVFLVLDGDFRNAPPGAAVWQQCEGDLGQRLEDVLQRGLAHHAWVVALGTDSPGLPPQYVEHIVELLAGNDAVLGPTADGGFYALGARCLAAKMLSEIRWSTENAATDAIAQLRAAGLIVATAPDWFDVDTEDDLKHLEAFLRTGTIDAPATKVVLARVGRL